MTKKEMTEIFAVMLLAWPNAEMFKGGIQKLGPTIELWATCLSDVDYWTAQRAVVRLCRECKFPPSIAEFKEKADRTLSEIGSEIHNAFLHIRNAESLYGTLDAYYQALPSDSRTKAVIVSMGGVERLTISDGGCHMWNISGFEKAYWALLKKEPTPAIGSRSSLAGVTAPRKENR